MLGVGYKRQVPKVNLFYTLREAFRYLLSLPSLRSLMGCGGSSQSNALFYTLGLQVRGRVQVAGT